MLWFSLPVDVTLDPDTAHPELILSEDGKEVRHGHIKQYCPDSDKRFDKYMIVLGNEGFSSGRFYFEVQVKGKTQWSLGVAKESIYRKGSLNLCPESGNWTLWQRNAEEYKACESSPISLSLNVKPQKVGVFVDYEEGLVSFYDVESRSHIYSFTGQAFTDKLYPFLSPWTNGVGKNAAPLIISPVNYNKWNTLKYEVPDEIDFYNIESEIYMCFCSNNESLYFLNNTVQIYIIQ